MQIIGLLALHLFCLYFLRLLWKEKNEGVRRGQVFTKMGNVTRRKSPGLFRFSVWVDFSILAALYLILIAYSISLILR